MELSDERDILPLRSHALFTAACGHYVKHPVGWKTARNVATSFSFTLEETRTILRQITNIVAISCEIGENSPNSLLPGAPDPVGGSL